jgi:hypothetical protein
MKTSLVCIALSLSAASAFVSTSLPAARLATRRSGVSMMAKTKKEPKTVGKNGQPVVKHIVSKLKVQIVKFSAFMLRCVA